MMGKNMSLNIRYRPQLLVGLVLGTWLYFFLVLVGPFDAAELPISIRSSLMLGYGLVFFLCYAVLIPIQNKLYHYRGEWKLDYEVAMVALFSTYSLPVIFGYYKTEIVNGTLGFGHFALTIYLPTIVILLPVVFVGRYLVARHDRAEMGNAAGIKTVTLLGDNKLDVLKLPMTQLVAVEAANNYVAVYYLLDGELQKKLLRCSLRKLHKAVPELIQVHRSFLVNLHHFVELKDGLTLVLTQFTVPVSQKYKSALLAMAEFAPK